MHECIIYYGFYPTIKYIDSTINILSSYTKQDSTMWVKKNYKTDILEYFIENKEINVGIDSITVIDPITGNGYLQIYHW